MNRASMAHADDRRGFLEHAGVFGQHIPNDIQGIGDVGAIGDAHRQIELPDVAVIVQNFTHNFPVGNDNLRLIGMQQRGRKKFDAGHLSLYAGNFNIFAETKGFGENNGQPGHQIAEHALHGQTNAHAGHADAGNHAARSGRRICPARGRPPDPNTSNRVTRTANMQIGGSTCLFSSHFLNKRPIHHAMTQPMVRMISAPMI